MSADVMIDLLDPSEAEVRAALPSDVQDWVVSRLSRPANPERQPRPRLESHDTYVFGVLVVPTLHDHGNLLHFQEICLLLDFERLVVVRKSPDGGTPFDLDAVREHRDHAPQSPGMQLYHLFNELAEHFLDIVDSFNEEIDELEDQVNTIPSGELRDRLSALRHDILHIRRVLAPTRDAARSVLDGRLDLELGAHGRELFPREVEMRFADAYDKLLRAVDALDLSRDLIAGVRDYHQSKVANDQNEVMKRLTIVSSLLLPPTFIVGLYGQNFDRLPELHWRFGYWFSWGLILASTIGQLIYFRRRRWM